MVSLKSVSPPSPSPSPSRSRWRYNFSWPSPRYGMPQSRRRAGPALGARDVTDDDKLELGKHLYEARMTLEQQARMTTSVQQVEEVLGPASSSRISEQEIRDSLWDTYFDVEGTISYFLDVIHRREKKKQHEEEAHWAEMERASREQPSLSASKALKISLKKPDSSATVVLSTGTARSPPTSPTSYLSDGMEGLKMSPSSRSRRIPAQTDQDRENPHITRPPRTRRSEGNSTSGYVLSKEKIVTGFRAEEKRGTRKPRLTIVVAGHEGAGKSMLAQRLSMEMEDSNRCVVESFRAETTGVKGIGDLPGTEEEEPKANVDEPFRSFNSQTRSITLIDAPGQRDSVQTLILAASLADAAILVIDATQNVLEKGFRGGGQTREQAILLKGLGVQQLVVAVNKLDLVDWSERAFQAIKLGLWPFLTTEAGFKPEDIFYVPLDAASGENLVESHNATLQSWWRYPGYSLVEVFDLLQVPTRSFAAALRVTVSDLKPQAAGPSELRVLAKIQSGVVQAGETLIAWPGDTTGVVRAIEIDAQSVTYAEAGAIATLALSGSRLNPLSPDTVLCSPSQPIAVVSSFIARIDVFEPKQSIKAGIEVEIFHLSTKVSATITRLDATLDRNTGKVLRSKPTLIAKNSSAQVLIRLSPAAQITLEPPSLDGSLGRIVVRRGGELIATGIVLEGFEKSL